MTKIRICRNPKCKGDIWGDERAPLGLCASCQWIGRVAFVAGAFLVGAAYMLGRLNGWWS